LSGDQNNNRSGGPVELTEDETQLIGHMLPEALSAAMQIGFQLSMVATQTGIAGAAKNVGISPSFAGNAAVDCCLAAVAALRERTGRT
jgi:hypothetical protein